MTGMNGHSDMGGLGDKETTAGTNPETVPMSNEVKMAKMLARMEKRQAAVSSRSTVSGEREDLIRKLDNEFYGPLAKLKDAADTGANVDQMIVVGRLQQILAEYALSIPSYELKRAQRALKEVQDLYAAPTEIVNGPSDTSAADLENKPKMGKLFSFARKLDEPESVIKGSLPSPTKPSKPLLAENGRTSPDPVASVMERKDNLISDRSGETIVLGKSSEGQHLRLVNLNDCTIKIGVQAASLQVKNMKGCQIVAVPVGSSVMLDGCQNCKFAIGCQQLRVHTSEHCDFYLFATSNPVVEDCTHVRFAPYDVTGVALPGVANQWDQVKDFNWLVANTPSPNWSIIPADERVSFSL